ncbi:MAG: glycosyltransferase family 4 protein [Acidimicrobiales bacterium]|nr:glycosyltransferase family 4 protein [Acidimicrobiales bacterium]
MPTCALLSFRLGLTDGVSVVALRWQRLLSELGFDVVTVAGEGPVDRLVPGLALDSPTPPSHDELTGALADIDLVIVENLCTIPLNLPASQVVADVLAGRPALLHHHDPPWQRDRFSHITELPPTDPAWVHVTINHLTQQQMAARGIEATTIYNAFDTEAPPGDRAGMRRLLAVADDELLVAHPVRAIARKNIPTALRIAEELDGTYWLLGQAEENYGPQLDWLLATARCRVIQRRSMNISDIYAAADLVVFPSLWEGFGNPPIEAAIHRRPVVVGDYPVGEELRSLGFRWFAPHELDQVRDFLGDPDGELLDHNRELAREHFSFDRIRSQLATLLADAGWLP